MTHHDPLDQQIAHALNTVADQVPVRDRLAEFDTKAALPHVRRWRFAEMPALAGATAFIIGLALVGGVLLTLRNNTNEPSDLAVPVVTTPTTPTTTTTTPAETAAGAGGPCLDQRNNVIGEAGVQIRSGQQVVDGNNSMGAIGHCPGHPDHGETVDAPEGVFTDRPVARIDIETESEVVVTAPGYPGAVVDLVWVNSDAPQFPDVARFTQVDSTTWIVNGPAVISEFSLEISLDWPEGAAVFTTIVGVHESETQAGGIPSNFDAGPQLAAEIRSELPPTYLRLGFQDGVVLVTLDGEALGHVTGQMEAPDDPQVQSQQLTAAYEDWGVPEGCEVDAVVGGTQLRVLCVDVGENVAGPTVEILSQDGNREIIAQLQEPPADLEGAFRLGRFVEVLPSPWNFSASLAQLSVECEARLAVMISDGVVSHLDATPWWGDAYPDGESVAIGWAPDQRALVWRFNGGCGGGLDVPGIYIYEIQGYGDLLLAVPDQVQWVELINPPEAIDTAAIYPSWTKAQLDDLIAADSLLQKDIEVVAAFATEMLGVVDPEVVGVGDATDSMAWEVAGNGFVASIRSHIIAWRADGSAINAVTYASTFSSSEEFYLSAQVEDNDGSWMAEFRFADIGDETTVVFSSADWTVQTTTNGAVATLDLPEEPVETPRLTITYRTGGDVVGFHGTLLPAGEFAAG